ncbi:MAG: hypothetical protein ACFB9M_12505 [Myxococcota bacterium]
MIRPIHAFMNPNNHACCTKVAALLILCASACASTRVTDSWVSPDHQHEDYEKVLVVAATDETIARNAFERQMATALRERGQNVRLGADVLPPNAAEMDRQRLRETLLNGGFGAVVVMSLVDVSREFKYQPPTYDVYYNTFPSYYGYHYLSSFRYHGVARPGTVTEKVKVALEANVYDLKGEGTGLVWNGVSKTIDPGSIEKLAKSYTKAMVKELYKAEIFR